MAYINISEWSSELVCCWLKGLDDSMYKYISFFANNGVGGQQLLNIRPYELEQLGMYSIGDQEIVLEAVENLRNFHYNLDKENLQFLALQVASASKNLYRQLNNHCDKTKLKTQILSDITRTIATIKPLISWLDRVPFQGQLQFNEIRRNMSRLGLEMATIAQRDRFVENPVDHIRITADRLTKLADYIIQDITDPMLIQPASLNLVTVKKRENDVGFSIEPSFHGIHRITEIKYNSPAHNSGKIENGDEIVQINYQTVVGWQYKTVIMQLRESTPDVLLTLKKRPKHTKIYGQIYMQPYRLPSKKRALTTRWSDNLPSPRVADFLTVPDFNLPLKITEEKNSQQNNLSDTDSSCSDILTPTDSKSVGDKEIRLYYPKPRAVLQRRNTICGDDLASLKNVGSIPLWHERSNRKAYHYHHQNGDPSSPSLRDKSVSFGFGLECTRPTTCLGITTTAAATSSNNITNGGGKFNDLIGLLPELYTENNGKLIKSIQDKEIGKIDEEQNKLSNNNNNNNKLNDEKSKPGVCKVVRFDANMKYDDYPIDNKYICNVENTILETFEPIPYVDDDIDDIDEINPDINSNNTETSPEIDTPKIPINSSTSSSNNNNIRIFTFEQNKCDNEICQAINSVVLNRRGRLDKSHSTPIYDNSGEDEADTPPPLPPAIEPRKEFLISPSPPPPPPRPKKISSETQVVPIPPPKPLFLSQKNHHNHQQQSIINNINTGQQYNSRQENLSNLSSPPPIPSHTINNDHHNNAEQQLELMTPLKTKTLTLKKKNSLMAKRRKITLKILGTGDIQGHLYRRTKDKRGVTFWAKLYFVLIETVLYGFRTKDANKANCMVVLPGFTVSLAKEVHSKPFAFKVYHTSKTFYFAAESSEALQQWMDFINQATMKNNNNSGQQNNDINNKKQQILDKDLFSETDSSGDEFNDFLPKQLCTPSPVSSSSSVRDFLQHQKNHLSSISDATPIKSDNKYLGSLKKLTKLKSNNSNNNNNNNSTTNNQHNQIGGSGGSNDNNNKKNSSDIPMPTAQFRCYRKVPGGSFGLQIGTQTSPYHDNNYSPQSQHLLSPPPQPPPHHQHQQQKFFPDQQPPPPPLRKPSVSSIQSTLTTNTELNNNNNNHHHHENISPLNTPNLIIENEYQNRYELTVTDIDNAGKLKLKRTSPFNFIHASNPNLVEFDFQTSKTLDHSMPKINIVGNSTCWDTVPQNNSLQGFVTLKDLMLQKQEEDAQEMYNNRVLLGVEKKDKMNRNNRNGCHNGNINKNNNNNDGSNNNINGNTKIKSKIQMRSLPKTPDYEMSFKPDDEDIKRTRSKAGLKLRDFGYEFISGDDVSTVIGDTQTKSNNNINKTLQNYQSQLQTIVQTNKKLMTTSSGSGEIQEKSSRGGSFKKTKGKFEAFKTSSEKIFQFKHHHKDNTNNNNNNDDLKSLKSISTTTYAPMTLPLNKKSQSQLYNMQKVDQQQHSISQCNIKKSQTYNNEFKDNNNKFKSDDKTLRKNSAPMPILSKFSFSSSGSGKSVKEKKLLGSPRLHRAIFGRSSSNRIDQDCDHEIFCPITFVKHPQTFSSETSSSNTSSPFDTQSITSTNSLPIVQQQPPTPIKTTNQTPEYPNMECPPVFEAETYSLSDPNASLTLLRRRNNNLEEDHHP